MKNIIKSAWLVALLFLLGVTISLAQTTTTISGTVFRDYNNNATQDAGEPGLAGVVVTAFNDESPVVSVSATTDINGNYTLPALTGTEARLEYTLSASQVDAFQPGVAGGTSVQFVTLPGGAITNVEMAFFVPTDFCQANPELVTACYANGDPLVAGTSQANDPWLVAFPSEPAGNSGQNNYLAIGEEIGSVWGTAYHRTSANVFTAAFIKRHSGLGPGGLDEIYMINQVTGVAQEFINVSTIGINVGATNRAAGDLSAAPNQPSYDSEVWSEVGRIGIGDIDASPDSRYLWLVNAAGNSIHRIFIGEEADVPTAADVTSYALPNVGCVGGPQQAWTLEIHENDVFVGITCTAASGGTAANLEGVIVRFDTDTNSFNATPYARFPLNYPRGDAIRLAPDGINSDWNPWTALNDDTFVRNTTGIPAAVPNAASYPQPLFSGLSFLDDGSITVGMMDRYGHQIGYYNYQTDGVDTTLYEGISAGDILRLCLVGGVYQLESDAQCDTIGPSAGQANGEGPGGGEFYFDDNFSGVVDHDETFVGGMAHRIGSGEIVTTIYDPFDIRTGGAGWYNNNDGAENDAYEIYAASTSSPGDPTPATFGKANGLGDLEFMCAPVPLEIGNRIWFDADQDGIQDAGEAPIELVEVELWTDTDGDGTLDLLATTTTDADGNYIFNQSNVTALIEGVTFYDVDGSNTLNSAFELNGIMPGRAYEIRVNTTQPALAALFLTQSNSTLNTTNNNLNDLNDSDGILRGDIAVIALTTGPMGANNHTLDYGFTDTPVVVPTPVNTPVASESDDVAIMTVDGVAFEITSLPRTGEEPWWRTWALFLSISGMSGIVWLMIYHHINRVQYE